MQNIINLPKPFNPPAGEYFYYVTPYGVVRDIKPASYKNEMYVSATKKKLSNG